MEDSKALVAGVVADLEDWIERGKLIGTVTPTQRREVVDLQAKRIYISFRITIGLKLERTTSRPCETSGRS